MGRQEFMLSPYLAETVPGRTAGTACTVTSGEMRMAAVFLKKGTVLKGISVNFSTNPGTPTHRYYALYDSELALLKQTVDAEAVVPSGMADLLWKGGGTYTVPSTGLYYLALVVIGASGGVVNGIEMAGALGATAPKLAGKSTTGLTTGTAPETAAAIISLAGCPYMTVY